MLNSADAALGRACQSLAAKNTLLAEDASVVDAALRDRIQVLEPELVLSEPVLPKTQQISTETTAPTCPADASDVSPASKPSKSRKSLRIRTIGAENFPAVKPRRYRNRDHLKFVSSQPCAVCGRQPCEAHHLRYAQPRALGVEFRMSSQCRCAWSTIASFTARAMSVRGGTKSMSILSR
jgi:hypothetical protein